MLNKMRELGRAMKNYRSEVEKILAQPESRLTEDQLPEITRILLCYVKDRVILKMTTESFFDTLLKAKDKAFKGDRKNNIEKLFSDLEKALK